MRDFFQILIASVITVADRVRGFTTFILTWLMNHAAPAILGTVFAWFGVFQAVRYGMVQVSERLNSQSGSLTAVELVGPEAEAIEEVYWIQIANYFLPINEFFIALAAYMALMLVCASWRFSKNFLRGGLAGG